MARPATKPAASPSEALAALRDDLAAQLAELREQISEARGRLELCSEGALPKADYLQRLHAWIDGRAAEFERGLEFQTSALRTPDAREGPHFGLLPVRGAGAASFEVVAAADASGLICWHAGSALKDRLAKVIEAAPYQEGPPLAERARLRREVDAELNGLELAEEKLICEAEEVGLDLPRRPDVRPEIVLSLELVEAP